MGKASRDKGVRGELEVAAVFTDAGLQAHRTSALQAGAATGWGDVTIRDFPELHVESKRTETYTLPEWLRQAEAVLFPGQNYVVAFRKSGAPAKREPWRGIVDLHWLARTLTELHELRGALKGEA